MFIAPKIKIGFQKRADCFTGKLAYIIYYDEKGKLRKETSWESWRDKTIPFEEFDNAPMEGFTINRDVKRYNGDWFSSKRTLIRVHDPRGFEFEVTTENLIAILMHSDCIKRGLIGQYVYAWSGKELVLLPTNSLEYEGATKYTSGLSKSVKKKELLIGGEYKVKKDKNNVIYMGQLNWHEYTGGSYWSLEGKRTRENTMVFTKDQGATFFTKDSVSFLSERVGDSPVSNYAKLIEKFNSKIYAHKIVKVEARKISYIPKVIKSTWNHIVENSSVFTKTLNPNIYQQSSVEVRDEYVKNSNEHIILGYKINKSRNSININDAEISQYNEREDRVYRYGYFFNPKENLLTAEQLAALDFFEIYVTFENGKEVRLKTLSDLTISSALKL